MSTQVFVNLTTRDLERSKAFYTALGCEINPLFSDENAACVVWSEAVYFMMLKHEFFSSFGGRPIADPAESTQVRTAFSRESREAVDAILAAGLATGGAENDPVQDLGFMYSRALEDPDGNILEFFYMDEAAVTNGPPAE